MKKFTLLSAALVAISSLTAQSSKTYAITSQGANDYYWANIREVNLITGKVTKTLFESDKTNFESFDAVSKASINSTAKAFSTSGSDKPFAYGVAASAFDAKHNRLYFSPMHTAQIRYIDLSSGEAKFFYLADKLIDNPTGYLTEENHLTRMVLIGKVGYAITNDGNHIFQFTTGKKPEVTDLGALIDDASNGALSVHNKCTSWGGDIVADEDGLLYLISANRHVFKVDIASRIAKHLGDIKGIPAQFTTNGAVVNDEGEIILTSANAKSSFYTMNLQTLSAYEFPNSVTGYSISDLANSNLLPSSTPKTYATAEYSKYIIANDQINVYPNPITTSQFKLSFDEMAKGNYAVTVVDLMGKQVFNKRVVVQNENQVETIDMGKKPSNGLYLVKITDATNKAVFVGKLAVQ
jgi:hypothetical protein